MYITNAFSLQMLDLDKEYTITIKPIDKEDIFSLSLQSAIGHIDTANVVSNELNKTLHMNRVNIKLMPGESIIVAQLTGGRLPEGSTTLPEGFAIKYILVTIQ